MAEQDPEEIISSTHDLLREVLEDTTVRRLGVATAGLATQRSSVAAWDIRTGKALAPVLSWQDVRARDWLQNFKPHAEEIRQRTGLVLSPHYGASKLRWYLDNVPEVRRARSAGYLAFGPLTSFMLFHLLQGQPLLVDHANASRTQLLNIAALDWDPWLLDLFGVERESLPHCRPVCHKYGLLGMAEIPLTAVSGDQNASIFSLGRPAHETATVNLGTGAFILVPTSTKMMRHPALLTSLASSTDDRRDYTIEGTVNGAGAALAWASEQWNLPDITRHLSNWLSREGDPPLFINTIGGLGSPWWQPGRAPTLLGDGESWQKAVAVAESIVFMLHANLEVLLETGLVVNRLQISGGLAHLNGICQRLADLTLRPVYRPSETEATGRGIAWLAGGRPPHWLKPGRGRVFRPEANHGLLERYRKFRQVLG
jgi:glycerol kinase